MSSGQELDNSSFYSLYCNLQAIHDRQTQDLKFKLHNEQILFEKEQEQWNKEKQKIIEENKQLEETIGSLKKLYEKIRHKKHSYAERYNKLVSKVSGINMSSSIDVSQTNPVLDAFTTSYNDELLSSDEEDKQPKENEKNYNRDSFNVRVENGMNDFNQKITTKQIPQTTIQFKNKTEKQVEEEELLPINLSQDDSCFLEVEDPNTHKTNQYLSNSTGDKGDIKNNIDQPSKNIENVNESENTSESKNTSNVLRENNTNQDPRSPVITRKKEHSQIKQTSNNISSHFNTNINNTESKTENSDNLNNENNTVSFNQKPDLNSSHKKNKKKRKRKSNKPDSPPSGKRRRKGLANIDDPFASQQIYSHKQPRMPPAVAKAIQLKRRNTSPTKASSGRHHKGKIDSPGENEGNSDIGQRGSFNKKRKVEYPYVYEKGELVRKGQKSKDSIQQHEENITEQQNHNNTNRDQGTETIAIRTAPTFVAKNHASEESSVKEYKTTKHNNDNRRKVNSPKESESYPNPFSDGESEEPQFLYREIVRKKSERQKLVGHDCPECRAFYEEAKDVYKGDVSKLIKRCSRHRYQPTDFTQDTPDNFWRIGDFDDYEENPASNTKTDSQKNSINFSSEISTDKQNTSDVDDENVEVEPIFIGTNDNEPNDFISPSY